MAVDEVRPGYKRTEVGVIPEDWESTSVGELCTVSSGSTPSRALHQRYFYGGLIPWVKTMDLNNSHLRSTSELITDLALKETSLRLNDVGSVLVAMYGGLNQIGRTALLTTPAAVNQAIAVLVPVHLLSSPSIFCMS